MTLYIYLFRSKIPNPYHLFFSTSNLVCKYIKQVLLHPLLPSSKNESLQYLHIDFPAFLPLLSKVSSPLSRLSIPFKMCHFKIVFAYTCSSFSFFLSKSCIHKMTSINLQDLTLATLPLSLHFLALKPHSLCPSQIDLLASFPCRHYICSCLGIFLLRFLFMKLPYFRDLLG